MFCAATMDNSYDRQSSRNTVKSNQSQSKMRRLSRYMKHSVADFFGVSEETEKQHMRWENRRKRYAGSIGKLKDGYVKSPDGLDEADSGRMPWSSMRIRDPLRRPSGMSSASGGRSVVRRPTRKDSVATMTMRGISNLVLQRKTLRKKTHKGPSIGEDQLDHSMRAPSLHGDHDAFSLVDDVFYDDPSAGPNLARLEKMRAKELHAGPEDEALQPAPAPGWRRRPPQPAPSTPGNDLVDGPDFGLGRIKEKVLTSAMRRDKRQIGVGVLGRFFRPSIRSQAFNKDVKQQLDEMDDHRPYFTYWATFVQIVVFIVAVSVYGIAPIGIGKHTEPKVVKLSNLARETAYRIEQENIWIGPRQADLIHLGAKYSPCMRVDKHLDESIALDRAEEKQSACCVRNDGSGCVQRGSLSTWKKWNLDTFPGPDNRTSGTVCGQDPSYCLNPASAAPFAWPDNIIEWPICKDTKTLDENQGSSQSQDRHMSCEILGRPCCHGIQGECFITTYEHCELLRGFFHEEAYLCSQVQCFEEICGMIPFTHPENPDQFYRLWTSLFLHGGLLHLLVTIAFQMIIMRDMEKLIGAIRMAIIYIGSGIAGNLASCTFLPYQVEAGPSGAQFGVLACLLVEVLQSFQMYRRPHIAILKLLVPIIGLFLLGLLPWFDNWAHLFGFLFGFLLAFALMPYVSFGKFDKRRKIISIVVSLGIAIGLFVILIIIFYVLPLTECAACEYFNCIPFTADFCDNMGVTLKKNSTYSAYY
ncbi:hypothetical protein BaRGS_00000815 [Batillaria attramentaria]|uniref:Peptidase S54 rhomboid domain-containing protein n=1 Tax=Batillaria attramentaria TaxID=370345 RepID=A0ABD0M7Y6_9CAEN